MISFDPSMARHALAQLPVLAAQESLTPPKLAEVYVPAHHAKALLIDASIVVGMRGAGKSWWTAVLASQPHRDFVFAQLHGSPSVPIKACVGFGLDETERDFPRPTTLNSLLHEGHDPQNIWLAVALQHALSAAKIDRLEFSSSWRERVAWVSEHRDEVNRQLTASDEALAKNDEVLLVLFDAFDRLSNDWMKVRKLTVAALQLGLQLRSRRAIRFKFFIRPDLDEDPEIWRFPDSSKLRHAKVDLTWSSADLYGLVFMRIGNASDAATFAKEFRRTTSREFSQAWKENKGVHLPPPLLTRNPAVQQPIIEAFADRYMGGGPKRGTTYTWVPLHLADAAGKISPRSYLLAFRSAAEHTTANRPQHQRALQFGAIQEGVISASKIRVQEIAEDYPWVVPLLEAARGAVVPISSKELVALWTPSRLRDMELAASSKLPPRRFSSDPIRQGRPEALVDDLVELAVLYRTKDGRLNIPDIFRVGFGIRRKGGVKPPR